MGNGMVDRAGIVAASMLLMLLWAAGVVAWSLAGIGRPAIDGTGSRAFASAARATAAAHRGNLALVLIDDGRIAASHAMSISKPVTPDTLFQVASISKWVTAWGVMSLVEAGKLDLDTPVSRYLTRWQLPPSRIGNDQVTVRRLLSHTAGLSDELGYCGFAPGAALQSLEASLTRAADACPLRSGETRVTDAVGRWRYSGGGFTLLQLLIEEVSGEPFADYMQRALLAPLGMRRSTFRAGAAGSTDVATFFDGGGTVAPHRRYTAAAAASLYASANDLARFAQAHLPGPNGEPPGRGVLSPRTLLEMRRPHAMLLGTPHWGLGLQLYAPSQGGGFIIGHNGSNVPAIDTTIRIEPASGDAIVALSSGGGALANRLGADWVALRRAAVTPAMVYGAAQRRIDWIAAGLVLILIGGVVALRTGRR